MFRKFQKSLMLSCCIDPFLLLSRKKSGWCSAHFEAWFTAMRTNERENRVVQREAVIKIIVSLNRNSQKKCAVEVVCQFFLSLNQLKDEWKRLGVFHATRGITASHAIIPQSSRSNEFPKPEQAHEISSGRQCPLAGFFSKDVIMQPYCWWGTQ